MSEHADVVRLARDLIRIDTTNFGEGHSVGERKAAEYVAAELADAGIASEIFESEPGRASCVARIEGADQSRGALVIHGHLDVVPADKNDWQFDPFSGEIKDDYLWGRGAVDMKDMCAMTLASVRQMAKEGRKPPRDLILAFVADEEAGGRYGARFLVDEKPELFDGATEAIGEVGFSISVGDLRLYLVETAQKGMHWMRVTAQGRAGHGSMINNDNAVTALCEAVARVGGFEFPVVVTPTVRSFLGHLSDALGIELDPDDMDATLAKLGPLARMVGATIRNTANPSMLEAGYKANVIPGKASAVIDGRFLPGQEEQWKEQMATLLGPDIQVEDVYYDIAVETEFDGALVDAMAEAVRIEDPGARTIPYMLSGGTDAKSLSRLGIRCFGFVPLQLPPELDFTALFHGVDERIPLSALTSGVRILDRFLMGS